MALALVIPTFAQARSNQSPCAMLASNQNWASALHATTETWGLSAGTVLAILDQESSMRATARGAGAIGANPDRNFGYAQASMQTWNWFRRATGRRDASRTDFADSAWFVGWYFAETTKRNGLSPNDVAKQYLAYKLGHGGYTRSGGNLSGPAGAVARQVAARAKDWDAQLARCLFSAPVPIEPEVPNNSAPSPTEPEPTTSPE